MEIFRVTGRLFQWKLGCMEHSIQSELHFTWELCERANTIARNILIFVDFISGCAWISGFTGL